MSAGRTRRPGDVHFLAGRYSLLGRGAMMDEKNILIRRWESALRSGDYRQGVGCLRHETAAGPVHCCLGVLCEVAGEQWEQPTKRGTVGLAAIATDQYGTLPWSLAVRLGTGPIPTLITIEGEAKLATVLNDNFRLSFEQIADCIRRTWPAAFDGR